MRSDETPTRSAVDEDVRESLLASAAILAGELGPEALRIPYVARRAGVPVDTAYREFATRDALISALSDQVAAELAGMMSIDTDLPGFIDYIVGYVIHHPEVARLWLYELMTGNQRADRDSVRAGSSFVAELVGAVDSREHDLEVVMHLFLGSVLVWALHANAEAASEADLAASVTRYTRELKSLLVHGLLREDQFPDLAADVARAESDR